MKTLLEKCKGVQIGLRENSRCWCCLFCYFVIKGNWFLSFYEWFTCNFMNSCLVIVSFHYIAATLWRSSHEYLWGMATHAVVFPLMSFKHFDKRSGHFLLLFPPIGFYLNYLVVYLPTGLLSGTNHTDSGFWCDVGKNKCERFEIWFAEGYFQLKITFAIYILWRHLPSNCSEHLWRI